MHFKRAVLTDILQMLIASQTPIDNSTTETAVQKKQEYAKVKLISPKNTKIQ